MQKPPFHPTFTLSATGHRPPALGGYSLATQARLRQFANNAIARLQPASVISGMALGWDTAIALAALDHGIPLTCAIPFLQQPSRWPTEHVVRWREIKKRAALVAVIAKSYSPEAMQLRNEYLVDNCQFLLALWNGQPGGTANCLNYAFRLKKREPARPLKVANLWSEFSSLPPLQEPL